MLPVYVDNDNIERCCTTLLCLLCKTDSYIAFRHHDLLECIVVCCFFLFLQSMLTFSVSVYINIHATNVKIILNKLHFYISFKEPHFKMHIWRNFPLYRFIYELRFTRFTSGKSRLSLHCCQALCLRVPSVPSVVLTERITHHDGHCERNPTDPIIINRHCRYPSVDKSSFRFSVSRTEQNNGNCRR